jgi:Flp pilus assembly protein TadD
MFFLIPNIFNVDTAAHILTTNTVVISQGKNQQQRSLPITNTTSSKAKHYHESAIEKSEKKQDYRAALVDIDKAIQLDYNNSSFYDFRAVLKSDKLKDFKGALMDLDKLIQLNPKKAVLYNNRGFLMSAAG